MNIDAYQQWTKTTAIYENHLYPVLGLAEEAGEVCGKIAKAIRDKTPVDRDNLTKELGDVYWMLARVADDFGIVSSDILQTNVSKLNSRKDRNVLGGSGDSR